jgi:hypothetical protein
LTTSTWSYAGRVEKNAYPTTEQIKKNGAIPKSNRPQLQTCGNSKAATPT